MHALLHLQASVNLNNNQIIMIDTITDFVMVTLFLIINNNRETQTDLSEFFRLSPPSEIYWYRSKLYVLVYFTSIT